MSEETGQLDEQERQWAEHVRKAESRGLCEYSGLSIHRCHRSVCDCFDAWNCDTCEEATR